MCDESDRDGVAVSVICWRLGVRDRRITPVNDRPMLVPRRLQKGHNVAVVSPSFGAPGQFPQRTERYVAYLESLGPRVRLMPMRPTHRGWPQAAGPPRGGYPRGVRRRPSRGDRPRHGGNDANQLLPLLDYGLIRRSPNIFQGYADITVLHWAFARHAALRPSTVRP